VSTQDGDDSITEGGLVRPLVRLAWPIVVIQLLQVAYNVADTLWLGQYDVSALGALSLAFPLVFLVISVAGGFTTAGSILVAQYTGAGTDGSAGRAAGQTLSFVLVLSAALAAVGFLVTEEMLSILPSDPATAASVVPQAARYMEVIFLGAPFLFGFFVFSALMRGYGDTRTPMFVMLASVALNVVLDPLLIFGVGPFPEGGIVGAAVATVFSRGLGTAVGVWLLFRGGVGPDLAVIREIVSLGVPSALEQSASALALVTLTAMVVGFAPPVVAAYGLGNRLASLVFLPAIGLGRATNTMVGQNLGAKKPDRATRAVGLAAGTGAGVMFLVAVVAAAAPEPLVRVFVAADLPDAPATIALATEYLRIRSVEFAFIGVFQVLLGAYRGAGNTRTALAFSLLALWVGRVPTVALLAFEGPIVVGSVAIPAAGLGPTGIWVGMTLGNLVGAVAAGLWFLRGTWKEAVVDTGRGPAPDAGPQED
jgi:putative MATE family efflux protein